MKPAEEYFMETCNLQYPLHTRTMSLSSLALAYTKVCVCVCVYVHMYVSLWWSRGKRMNLLAAILELRKRLQVKQ